MAIVPFGDRDPSFVARRRVAAFGGDHERGFELLAIGEHGGDSELAAFALHDFGAGMPGDQRLVLRRLEQREAELAIGEHQAERTFVRLGLEVDAARLHPVGDRDRGDRAAVGRERTGEADVLEQVPARGRDRRGTAVEAFGGQFGRIGAVDDVAGDALACCRQRKGHSDEAAAEDQEVALVRHRPVP